MSKPVRTIADIAKLAGVSKSTVSRALRDSNLISEATRERVQAIAREHNFRIHQPARSLSLKQTNTIAFVTHGQHKNICVEDLFLLEMMGAITVALAEVQYDLLVVNVDPYDTEWISEYLDTGKVDGFILMTSTYKQNHIRELMELQAPFIAWGVPEPGANYCSVTGDNLNGGRLAGEYLLSIGKRKIGFIGGPSVEQEVKLRYQGFESALEVAGITVDPKHVAYGHFSSESGAKLAHKLLDQDPELDSIFANSDLIAMGAVNAIRERGQRVPEDLSVVGYDDISLASYCSPPLTTVRQNIPESGRLLVQNLIQYLQNGVVTNGVVPVELIVRGSTHPS
jgi:DNA-binding LacI/PurR family transcriptional regulator